MTIQLNDTVITTLQTRLAANLPAIVTAINASATPVFPIIAPQQVLDYVPPLADLYVFPTLGISDGPMRLVDDVGWGATGEQELTVVCYEQDADIRTLAWKLRRHQQAIVRAIRTPTLILGDGWGTYDYQIVPGPTLSRDEGPRQFMSTTSVSFKVKTEQDV
jgi:hypothetical protein